MHLWKTAKLTGHQIDLKVGQFQLCFAIQIYHKPLPWNEKSIFADYSFIRVLKKWFNDNFVALWLFEWKIMKELVFPFREGKNFTRLSSEHIIILYLQIFYKQKYISRVYSWNRQINKSTASRGQPCLSKSSPCLSATLDNAGCFKLTLTFVWQQRQQLWYMQTAFKKL